MIMKRILGLDVSTTTIGVAILDYDGYSTPKLVHTEFFHPPDKSNISPKSLAKIKKYITNIFLKYKPDYIAIEEFIQFMKGGSGAKTIIPLAVFNRTIGLTLYELSEVEPIQCNVNSIRAKLKIGTERPKKEDMPAIIEKRLKIKFPWYYKMNRRTKQNVVDETSLDVADAISVGLYFIENKLKI